MPAVRPAVVDFIEAQHPNAVNIGKNRGEGRYIVIKQFDDDVFQALASVPDTDSYWVCDRKFERVR